MTELKQIKAKLKKGDESLTFNGINTQHTLLDFWRWSTSNILSNATRGRFAEFIVGTAVGMSSENVREEWDAYDLISKTGIKIEVKSAAYIQSWHQNKLSAISFSIKSARYWDSETNNQRGESRRHADVYVFCHLKHKEKATVDPLKMEQWDFYILPTYSLDNYKRSQSSISLNSLKKLANAEQYIDLKDAIAEAYQKQQGYMPNFTLG